MALQVNVISTALVALLIMPLLKETAMKTGRPSQLTLMSSNAHKNVAAKDVDTAPRESSLKKVNAPEYFQIERSYKVIKLLTEYVKVGLVDHYSRNANPEVDVFVNSLCPGYCKTDLGWEFPWYISMPTNLMQLYYGRTAEQGGRSLVSATLLGKDGYGKFWSDVVFAE